VVVAEIVLKPAIAGTMLKQELKNDILAVCRELLAPHKIPAVIRFAPTLPIGASGKLSRQ
jgi:acyl-coenzyme A synthetase/AMP-(fatty) acid ligase